MRRPRRADHERYIRPGGKFSKGGAALMAARVDIELGREFGVSPDVVVTVAEAIGLRRGEHIYKTGPASRQRKQYTEAAESLLRDVLEKMPKDLPPGADPLQRELDQDAFRDALVASKKAAANLASEFPPEPAQAVSADLGRADKKNAAGEPQGGKAPVLLLLPPEPLRRPATLLLRIIRIFPNPIWVLVATPAGKTAEVRVRHSRLLEPGKFLRCAPTVEQGWECADPLLAINPIWK